MKGREKMKKNSKQILAFALLISVVMSLSACGNKKSGKSDSESTDIVWYVMGSRQKDQDAVMDEINKKLNEKYQLNLELNVVDSGAYSDKMNMIMASNTEYDLCWTSNWSNPFSTAAESGAFYKLDELLAGECKGLFDALPEFVWDDAKVKNEIYAVPNYQVYYHQGAIYIPTNLVEKYNIDTQSIKSLYDLEPVLKILKEKEPDLYTFNPNDFAGSTLKDYHTFNNASFLAVKEGDADFNILSTHELPEYYKEIELYRDWYNQGYIRKDIVSAVNESSADTSALRYAVWFSSIKPGIDAINLKNFGEPITTIPLRTPLIKPNAGQATMNAVSNSSENPAKALKLLEVMNTDKEIYNMMCFGIEGTHYEKISENTVRTIENNGKTYNPNKDWVFGNQFNAYVREGQSENVWEETDRINRESEKSPLRGFNIDFSNIKSEVAKINAILSEYNYIYLGAEEPKKSWDERIEKLKTAGIDKVIEEVQRQIDEWKATK